MYYNSKSPFIVCHFGDDIRHNDLCSETAQLLRSKYNLVAARTSHEMKTPINDRTLSLTFLYNISEQTHAELLASNYIFGAPKIVITNTPDMIIAATQRKIPVISFSCEFAGVSGQGFYASTASAAADEIRRTKQDRLAFLQGLSVPSVA